MVPVIRQLAALAPAISTVSATLMTPLAGNAGPVPSGAAKNWTSAAGLSTPANPLHADSGAAPPTGTGETAFRKIRGLNSKGFNKASSTFNEAATQARTACLDDRSITTGCKDRTTWRR